MSPLDTFAERFEYLALGSTLGDPTFGSERYLNQRFYTSREWRAARRQAIIRDNGCDLGIQGLEIFDRVYVHHMNPITVEQVEQMHPHILDPEYLITVSLDTHNAIHFGNKNSLKLAYDEREEGDTSEW